MREELIDELYGRLDRVAERVGSPRLSECTGRDPWPPAGVYFFFEDGEVREDGIRPRVVRVGTHALTATSKTSLWTRIRAHRGTTSGRNAGGGNHRGSIFRLHVGTALIGRGGWEQGSKSWGQGSSAPREVRDREVELEQAVSAHLGAMRIIAVDVPDRSDRARLEQDCISLLSNHSRPPVDPASDTWLGRDAAHPDVRDSHLWNVNRVRDPSPAAPALRLIA